MTDMRLSPAEATGTLQADVTSGCVAVSGKHRTTYIHADEVLTQNPWLRRLLLGFDGRPTKGSWSAALQPRSIQSWAASVIITAKA